MTYLEQQIRIAENLGMLASDGTTILDGKVTQLGIKNQINDVYLEVLFPKIAEKFPKDFEQFTYPINTNVGSFTASASSSGTHLVSSTNVFSNSMEGFTLYNLNDGQTAKISAYIDNNEVTIDTDVVETWDGDTIYILGNEFTFGDETVDIKEVTGVYVKYIGTNSKFIPADRTDLKTARVDQDYYSTGSPKFYVTNVDIGGTTYPAVGLLPYPTNYNGKIMFSYIEKPAELSADGDTPVMKATGLHQVIINGVTAWGKRQLGKFDEAQAYEEIDRRTQEILPRGTAGVINSYKPITRSGSRKIQMSPFIASLGM